MSKGPSARRALICCHESVRPLGRPVRNVISSQIPETPLRKRGPEPAMAVAPIRACIQNMRRKRHYSWSAPWHHEGEVLGMLISPKKRGTSPLAFEMVKKEIETNTVSESGLSQTVCLPIGPLIEGHRPMRQAKGSRAPSEQSREEFTPACFD